MPSEQEQSVELLPCPSCGGTDIQAMTGAPGCTWIVCKVCGLQTDDGFSGRVISQWNGMPRSPQSLAVTTLHAEGWIIGNGSGDKWRTMEPTGWAWTSDRDEAVRYARRCDAETVHAEDEDAWLVEPYTPTPDAVNADKALVAEAADLLDEYADYIRTVPSVELERHPYLPAIEDVAERLRTTPAPDKALANDVEAVQRSFDNACAELAAEAVRSAFLVSVSGEDKPYRYHLRLAYPTMGAMHEAEDALKALAAHPKFQPLAARLATPAPDMAPMSQAAVGAWKSIQTAPRGDGVMRLLFEPHHMGGFMFVGCCERLQNVWFNNLDQQTQHPTHWMELPSAPGTTPTPVEEPEKGATGDNCEICHGDKGGVRGNENRVGAVGGIVACDYCTADGSAEAALAATNAGRVEAIRAALQAEPFCIAEWRGFDVDGIARAVITALKANGDAS